MSTLVTALAYRRLLTESATLHLLRADHVAVIAAALGEHLGRPGLRLASEDLHELMDADLEVLRDQFELSTKTAKAYCDDWRNAGFLIRRPAGETRGETYELSAAGFDALRILDQLRTPQTTVTESRLVSLAAALHQLAVDTDPDSSRRLAALEQERDRIDQEIARIREGEITILDEDRARERVQDVLLQAQGLPADFARVRARFEELNQELRASILTAEEAQSTVLDDVFRGVDLIESSDEGRTFAAFSALIRDPEQSTALDEDILAVLGRDFAVTLPPATRRALRELKSEMRGGSREIHEILTEFARGLRRYVYSQEFRRDRALRTLLQEALAAAVQVRGRIRPYADVGQELELSAMRMSSVGEVTPFDPSEFDTGSLLEDDVPEVVDFEELAAIARESEIDFTELIGNVNAMFRAIGPVSVGAVLEHFPATQGVASVVGLLSLATKYGEVSAEPGLQEVLGWEGGDGVARLASVARHRFTREVGE
nr:DUF3375 domain-containing protein [Actinomycetales bacterium]